MQLTVYTTEGRLIQSFKTFVLGSSIDMRSYAPGIYLLKITDKPALNASEFKITARRLLAPSFSLSMLTPEISEM